MIKFNFSHITSAFSGREDTEHHQAFVRIAFCLVFIPFIYLMYFSGWHADVSVYALYVVTLFGIAAFWLVLALIMSPGISPRRRLAGIFVDISSATLLLITGGAPGSIAFGAYLWVTIANGLRYGRKYLYIAHISSIAAFSLVLITSDYWQQNLFLGLSLLVWLLLLPVYVSQLLRKLEHTVERAERANKAKSAFLANMSHEIRTPLTAIIGYADLSLDRNQSVEERTTALKTILHSGNHLLRIINDILDFSKIEADRLEMDFATVDPFLLVRNVETIIRPLVEKKGLAFTVVYDYPLPALIRTDPVRLEQILLNLYGNAAKFTAHGSVTLLVKCDWNRQSISFRVSDTGIGMTQEQVGGLFSPFMQADSSTTRRYGGTGLGLSLSKRLAEKLGGSIQVQSEYGRGSTFTLAIPTGPLHDVLEITNKTEVQSKPEPVPEFTGIGKFTGHILLAEDNETIQQLLSLFLRKMGATVTVAGSGLVAVQYARQFHYDLVFMDMQMPVMSGTEAVERLRQIGYTQPIVALTANATVEDKMACLAAGCNDFLAKPISRDQLYVLTAKYLNDPIQTHSVKQPIVSTLLQDDPSFNNLVKSFITEDLPQIVSKLRQSCADKDWQLVKNQLHDLKGMGGGYGFQILTDLASRAESQLSMDDTAATEALIVEIGEIAERIYQSDQLQGMGMTELKRDYPNERSRFVPRE